VIIIARGGTEDERAGASKQLEGDGVPRALLDLLDVEGAPDISAENLVRIANLTRRSADPHASA
jgi:hypothetical protein